MIFMLSDTPVRSHDPILLIVHHCFIWYRVKCADLHEYQQCLHQELVGHPSWLVPHWMSVKWKRSELRKDIKVMTAYHILIDIDTHGRNRTAMGKYVQLTLAIAIAIIWHLIDSNLHPCFALLI